MGTKEKQTIAGYFGLAVEVLCRMASSSLIRYRERVFIVETLDLDSCWRLGWGGWARQGLSSRRAKQKLTTRLKRQLPET
jgi:hypothetical protein